MDTISIDTKNQLDISVNKATDSAISSPIPPLKNDKEMENSETDHTKKIDSLLHSEQEAKRLIGVMSLYGRIYYDWHLDTDLIDWRGPIQHLIRSTRGIVSGDIFLRRLNQLDFDNRMMLLEEACRTRKTFHATYHLNVIENIYCQIEFPYSKACISTSYNMYQMHIVSRSAFLITERPRLQARKFRSCEKEIRGEIKDR